MESDLDGDLERRLRRLATRIRLNHADESAIARLAVPPRREARKRRGRLVAAAASLVAALIVGNGMASYLAPRYAAALASAPAVNVLSVPALRWAGLAAGSLTVVGDEVTADGHTVRLLAGRADTLRTVLFIEVDGVPPGSDLCLPPQCTDKRSLMRTHPDAWFPSGVTVTDQFGHAYGQTDYDSFEPLAGPAAAVGARLTVRVERLVRPRAGTGRLEAVSGDWTLHATLLPQSVPTLVLPPPAQIDGNTYRVTSAKADGLATLDFLVSGPAVEQVRSFAYGPPAMRAISSDPRQGPLGQLNQRYFDVRVTRPDGADADVHSWGYTMPRQGPMQGQVVFATPIHGIYRIHFGTGAEVSITVPAAPQN